MNELHESVDMNKLYFKYIGNTKDVNFYEYMDSKQLFDKIKIDQLKFYDALKNQKDLLNKINEVKIGRKSFEQEKVITNLENFTNLERKFLIFLETIY